MKVAFIAITLMLAAFATIGATCDLARLNHEEPTPAAALTYGAGGRCGGMGGIGIDMAHKYPEATFTVFEAVTGLTGSSQGLVETTARSAELINNAGYFVHFGHCKMLTFDPRTPDSNSEDFTGSLHITCQMETDGRPSMFDDPLPSGYGMQWAYADGGVDGSGYLYDMYQDSFIVEKDAYANCTRTGG